jgi:hypothetical protein
VLREHEHRHGHVRIAVGAREHTQKWSVVSVVLVRWEGIKDHP